jgi:hypothetical protein
MTGTTLITDALQLLGSQAPGESLTAVDGALALRRLNDWIDSLGLERQLMNYVLRTTKTLTPSTASYTIGTGGNISMVRPTYLDRAGMVVDTTATVPVEIPIQILTDQEYARETVKSLTSTLATSIYYDHNWSAGLGRIYVLPIPTVSTTQLVIYTPQAATEFADLTTDYTFPPGVRRFYRFGLACELWADYAQVADIGWLQAQRDEARAAVKRANVRLEEMPIDAALTGGPGGIYNIYSDGYSSGS